MTLLWNGSKNGSNLNIIVKIDLFFQTFSSKNLPIFWSFLYKCHDIKREMNKPKFMLKYLNPCNPTFLPTPICPYTLHTDHKKSENNCSDLLYLLTPHLSSEWNKSQLLFFLPLNENVWSCLCIMIE